MATEKAFVIPLKKASDAGELLEPFKGFFGGTMSLYSKDRLSLVIVHNKTSGVVLEDLYLYSLIDGEWHLLAVRFAISKVPAKVESDPNYIHVRDAKDELILTIKK